MKKTFNRVSLLLLACLLAGWEGQAQILDNSSNSAPVPVRGEVSISRAVNITPSNEKVSLNMRDANLRDVLNLLAQEGHFNLILDESVSGTFTVDIKNVSINKALEYIFMLASLSYTKDGNTVIITTKSDADEKNLNAKTLKAIPILYKDATSIANQLNKTIFKVSRPGGSNNALASSDPESNSLLVLGTESDIQLVNNALKQLDVPRNRKVYKIRHNTPAYVAQVLALNFFTPMTSTVSASAGGGTGATGAPAAPGAPGATGGASAASASASPGAAAAAASIGTSNNKPSITTFTTGGVTFISEPVSSTLTVMGSEQQLGLIDGIINQVDVRRPQAVIEVSLVEMNNQELQSFTPTINNLTLGRTVAFSSNAPDSGGGLTNASIGFNQLGQARVRTPFSFSITQNHESIKGKVLANPTIVALDGTSSTIAITDQTFNFSQTVVTATASTNTVATATAVNSGVTLTITPQISNDGYIVLNLNPVDVSQPGTAITLDGTTVTPISDRRLTLDAVRVKDGDTLVIGGLIRETNNTDINRIPGLDKLPILSAIFRSMKSGVQDKTELVLMVTPHILKDDAATYFDNTTSGKNPSTNQGPGGLQPINLPHYDTQETSSVTTPASASQNNPTPNLSSTSSANNSMSVSHNTPLPLKASVNNAKTATMAANTLQPPAQEQLPPVGQVPLIAPRTDALKLSPPEDILKN